MEIPQNYYKAFDVTPDQVPNGLKSRFKRLSILYHPDKNPSEEAAKIFLKYRSMYEVLMDDVKRNVYDMFGSQIFADCTQCISYRDYLSSGFSSYLVFNGSILVLLVLYKLIGSDHGVQFWRFVMFGFMVTFEGAIIAGAANIDWVKLYFPSLTTSEFLKIIHHLYVNLSIALSLLGPLIFVNDATQLTTKLSILQNTILCVSKTSENILQKDLEPFEKQKALQDVLLNKAQKKFVDSKLMQIDSNYGKMQTSINEKLFIYEESNIRFVH
ncbi:hypothetical protein ROZALSC1DRAFT_27420 [Rozella allomycis CSF55]|uniref:J domain-containing protein n=1 Tax=Rozella allomycis (strain CSF55) TaxID=988480 RepID=A0A075B162_ROZAC|nr:hypothetical protein O9G_001822 [Rozella allomycis CSF55]RKP21147.1 hypothetical protein ROZALSC1DRAFT_27417 [Rozella allomycis CSF55]RKP21150.1 hypothetical protein ROZALSC1DRAFT_27420 [Rozella allomycis CSF55]|eukprot:EPZ34566.1 hypothetical protein O9G_001822 [Rozella allomycis CSF55]